MLDSFRAERNAGMTALIEALRTPEERFVRLPNYTFRPHYLDDLKGYEGLRVHTVDERLAKPATNMQTPANTRVSLAARDSRWWSLRSGVGQGDRGSCRYRVRLGLANVRFRG